MRELGMDLLHSMTSACQSLIEHTGGILAADPFHWVPNQGRCR